MSPIPPFATTGTVPFSAMQLSQAHRGFFESESGHRQNFCRVWQFGHSLRYALFPFRQPSKSRDREASLQRCVSPDPCPGRNAPLRVAPRPGNDGGDFKQVPCPRTPSWFPMRPARAPRQPDRRAPPKHRPWRARRPYAPNRASLLPAAGIRPRSDDTRLPTSARPANPLAIMGTQRRRGWFL